MPGGTCTHWKAPPCHGAHPRQTPYRGAAKARLSYYLANKRFEDFVEYLKDLGHRSPLARTSPQDQLADFRRHFGNDLVKLDKSFQKYLAGMPRDRGAGRRLKHAEATLGPLRTLDQEVRRHKRELLRR